MRVLVLLFCLAQSFCLNATELPKEDVARPGIQFYFQFQLEGTEITRINIYRFRDEHEIYRYLVVQVTLSPLGDNSYVIDGEPCNRSVARVYGARRAFLGQVMYCNNLTKENITETIRKIVDVYATYASI